MKLVNMNLQKQPSSSQKIASKFKATSQKAKKLFKRKKSNNNKNTENKLASETLLFLSKKEATKKYKISSIIEEFHENGFAISLIFFSLPIAIPLPYPPGVTTLFGVPLFILAIQMILGYHNVRLPKWLSDKEISGTTLKMLAEKALPILKSVEKILQPRLNFTQTVFAEQLVGFVSLICAVAIAIPLPLTNAVPAAGITIMSLSMLRRDGLVLLGGVAVSIIGLVIATIATLGALTLAKMALMKIFA